jgi:heme/copper-type cytochrome/quinol oxidase subunit 2
MFRLDVLQNQWLILALVGGTALVLFVALAYVAVWRAARNGDAPQAAPGHARNPVPWIVIVFWLVAALYAVVYIVQAVLSPPTW